MVWNVAFFVLVGAALEVAALPLQSAHLPARPSFSTRTSRHFRAPICQIRSATYFGNRFKQNLPAHRQSQQRGGMNVVTALSLDTLRDSVMMVQNPPTSAYFWYLLAAGCGCPLPEEPMIFWVGMKIAQGIQENIAKTLLYIYLGVVLSDWIPFFVATLIRKGVIRSWDSKNSENETLTPPKAKFPRATKLIKASGRLIGVIARFAPGLRSPIFVAAGALGVSPLAFCLGDMIGALFTLPIQLAVGAQLARMSGSPTALIGGATLSAYAFGALLAVAIPTIMRRKLDSQTLDDNQKPSSSSAANM